MGGLINTINSGCIIYNESRSPGGTNEADP
jgi:hypothetical protein